MPALFSLGQVVITTNLQHTLDNGDPDTNSMEELKTLIDRHVSGDWGDLDAQDKAANDQALKTGGRIFSAYTTNTGIKLWIITEADRSYTTCLLPADY